MGKTEFSNNSGCFWIIAGFIGIIILMNIIGEHAFTVLILWAFAMFAYFSQK